MNVNETVERTRQALLERIEFFEANLPPKLATHVCGRARALIDMGELGKAHSMLHMWASVAKRDESPQPELHGLARTAAALASNNPNRRYTGPMPPVNGLARVESAFRTACQR